MASPKPIFLDVDSSIVENNLRITNSSDEEFNQLFGNRPDEYPSKIVTPHPGFCIKTKEVGTDIKVFVNICTTDSIPPPKDITSAELEALIESEDASDFRVPMSIGEIRSDKDNKGNEAKVADVAIHPDFFTKIQTYAVFKNFLMAVVFQGLLDKYGLVCADKKIILINKKAYGKLQSHRIQQREIDQKMGKISTNKSLIDELKGQNAENKKVVIETISSTNDNEIIKEPEYRLYKKKSGPNCLIGEFKLPETSSVRDISLDIGEDRILLETKSKYMLDIFIPYFIRLEKCTSSFDKSLKILTVVMPLVGG